jgi:hypothetical protein
MEQEVMKNHRHDRRGRSSSAVVVKMMNTLKLEVDSKVCLFYCRLRRESVFDSLIGVSEKQRLSE